MSAHPEIVLSADQEAALSLKGMLLQDYIDSQMAQDVFDLKQKREANLANVVIADPTLLNQVVSSKNLDPNTFAPIS